MFTVDVKQQSNNNNSSSENPVICLKKHFLRLQCMDIELTGNLAHNKCRQTLKVAGLSSFTFKFVNISSNINVVLVLLYFGLIL